MGGGHEVDEERETDRAAAHAAGYDQALKDVEVWLRRYAEHHSGSHPANAGYIACQAAANAIQSGEWKETSPHPHEGG